MSLKEILPQPREDEASPRPPCRGSGEHTAPQIGHGEDVLSVMGTFLPVSVVATLKLAYPVPGSLVLLAAVTNDDDGLRGRQLSIMLRTPHTSLGITMLVVRPLSTTQPVSSADFSLEAIDVSTHAILPGTM